MKVKTLISKLKKVDPDAEALFHCCIKLGKETFLGYASYENRIATTKLLLAKGKTGLYVESQSAKAFKAVVII